jgi:plastocyanin
VPARWRLGAPATLVAAAAVALAQAAPQEHVVLIEGMAFHPAALHVKPGDRIVWINRDLVPHTATGQAHAFDSGRIAAGAQWRTTAPRSGTYAYDCAYHPTMSGTLVVD